MIKNILKKTIIASTITASLGMEKELCNTFQGHCISPNSHTVSSNDLFLVVGSNRASSNDFNFICNPLWGEQNRDKNLLNSYGGQATSMDIKLCSLPNVKHIQGDARNYDFGNQKIRKAYIERLPTYILRSNKQGENCLSDSIINIAKSIVEGGDLEIELHPFTVLLREPYPNNAITIASNEGKNDPFTGFFDINSARVSTFYACDKIFEDNYTDEIRKDAAKMASLMKELLTFYESKGVGSIHDLKERLKLELYILDTMWIHNNYIFLKHGPASSLEKFAQSLGPLENIRWTYSIPHDQPIVLLPDSEELQIFPLKDFLEVLNNCVLPVTMYSQVA